jgi:hypothetical protein
VERGADLPVVRMLGIVDDLLPRVLVPLKTLAVLVIGDEHVLDEVVERVGEIALRVIGSGRAPRRRTEASAARTRS